MNDPRDILKAAGVDETKARLKAGVQCPELDEFWDIDEPFIQPSDAVDKYLVVAKPDFVTKADSAVLALAKLVAKYKWQREIQVVGLLDYNGAIASLDRMWEEHCHEQDADGHHRG